MRRVPLLLGVAALFVLPLFANVYVEAFLTRIMIYAIFAMSLDLILGFGGLVSLGHAAFFGAGAYCAAILILHGITSAWVGLIAAIGTAGLLALAIGAMALRVRGIYFIMLTFAFAQMLFFLAIGQPQWGGDDGVSLPGHMVLVSGRGFDDPRLLFYTALILLGGVFMLLRRLTASAFGLALQASRQDEIRLRTLGFPVYGIRLAAFTVAGASAGIAGFLSVNLDSYLSPSLLDWRISGIVMMIVVIGGVGTLIGPVLGAVFYLVVEEVASRYTDHWLAGFGLLLAAVALFWHQGLYGLRQRRTDAFR